MDPSPTPLTPKPVVRKVPFETAAKRLEIDLMCHFRAKMNPRSGYRMNPSHPPRPPNREVANRRPQIEHIMWCRRAAWSPLW